MYPLSIIKRILSICHRKIIPIQRTGYFRASIRAEQLEPRLVLSGVVLSGCNNDDEPITLDTIELHDGTGNSNLSIQQLIDLKSLQNVNDGTVESIFATFENISDMDDLYDQISHEKGGEFKVDDIAARAIDDLITRPQQIISKVSRRHNNNIMPAASEQAEGEGSPLPGTIYDSRFTTHFTRAATHPVARPLKVNQTQRLPETFSSSAAIQRILTPPPM